MQWNLTHYTCHIPVVSLSMDEMLHGEHVHGDWGVHGAGCNFTYESRPMLAYVGHTCGIDTTRSSTAVTRPEWLYVVSTRSDPHTSRVELFAVMEEGTHVCLQIAAAPAGAEGEASNVNLYSDESAWPRNTPGFTLSVDGGT